VDGEFFSCRFSRRSIVWLFWKIQKSCRRGIIILCTVFCDSAHVLLRHDRESTHRRTGRIVRLWTDSR
jgi:hypothetical protein